MADKSENPLLPGSFISIHVEWGPNLSWYHGRRLAVVDQCIHTENEVFKRKEKRINLLVPFWPSHVFLILFTGFQHAIVIKQTWRGSCTCVSHEETICAICIHLFYIYSLYRTHLPWRQQRFWEQTYCSHITPRPADKNLIFVIRSDLLNTI